MSNLVMAIMCVEKFIEINNINNDDTKQDLYIYGIENRDKFIKGNYILSEEFYIGLKKETMKSRDEYASNYDKLNIYNSILVIPDNNTQSYNENDNQTIKQILSNINKIEKLISVIKDRITDIDNGYKQTALKSSVNRNRAKQEETLRKIEKLYSDGKDLLKYLLLL